MFYIVKLWSVYKNISFPFIIIRTLLLFSSLVLKFILLLSSFLSFIHAWNVLENGSALFILHVTGKMKFQIKKYHWTVLVLFWRWWIANLNRSIDPNERAFTIASIAKKKDWSKTKKKHTHTQKLQKTPTKRNGQLNEWMNE